jgi:alpha-L-rhamnosidase
MGDLWDSHKIVSNFSGQHPGQAGGKRGRFVGQFYYGNLYRQGVGSRSGCYWKVKSLDYRRRKRLEQPAHFTVGLLSPADWKAKWIGYDNGFPWDSVSKFSRLSARYYRKQFHQARRLKKLRFMWWAWAIMSYL